MGVVTSAAGFALMKNTLDELHNLASGEVKKKLKKLANANKQAEIMEKIRKIGMVKTLWDNRDEINLNTIYHPTIINDGNSCINVGHVNKLPDCSGILIEGSVGQGKSTFMRFLVCSMAQFDSRIPVFLELRNIRVDEGLVDALKRQLDVYGFKSDNELFDFYCKSGKFVIFLDGFDELKFESIQGVVIALSDLRLKYGDSLKIIVSSRPRGGLAEDPLFKVISILPITSENRTAFLKKIDKNKERSERLSVAINESTSEVLSVLNTPLMLTLLSKIHSAYNHIPETFIDFYEKLFMAMYRDHDDTKPGFSRRIRSGLNPNQVESVFSLFSFFCSVDEKFSFCESDCYRIMSKAADTLNYDPDVSGLMNDVVDVACMLVKDGGDYYFIHKSICEYYAAKYIKSKDDGFKEIFYGKVLKNFNSWAQQLEYLRNIDAVPFYKYFYMPHLERAQAYRDKLDGEFRVTVSETIATKRFGFSGEELSICISKKDFAPYFCFDASMDLEAEVTTAVYLSLIDVQVGFNIDDVKISERGVNIKIGEHDMMDADYDFVDGLELAKNSRLVDAVLVIITEKIKEFDAKMIEVRSILEVERCQSDMLSKLSF